MNVDIEEKIYEQIALEIQSNNISDGLWVKATQLTATDNKNIIRAKYIDLRKDQIHREMIFRNEQLSIKNQQIKIRNEQAKIREEQLAKEAQERQRQKEWDETPLLEKIVVFIVFIVFFLVVVMVGVMLMVWFSKTFQGHYI